ncbi:MAG: S41 family peptidase [Phycisphaeraceae bacterium]
MHTRFRPPLLTAAAAFVTAALVACGGGSGGGMSAGGPCSTTNQKQFVLDATREWYLFQDLLPASVSIASFATAQDLLDALTATARAQGKDRFFSFLTTPQADSSFFQEGQFIGFGFRTSIQGNRLFVPDVFEASPASEGGLTRGVEITAVDSGSGFVSMATILATDPNLEQAFGPANEGVQRGLRFLRLDGEQIEVTLTKRIVTILPVPPAGGTAVIAMPANPSVPVGYISLRTFISTAEAPLRNAYAQFRAQGIQNFIVDFRYNGGGLVSIADFVGDLHGMNRGATDVYSNLRFNPAKSSNDSVRRFISQPQSVDPVRIAFITTGGTASASELVINSMKPWVEVAIVGADTFGKPVGQSAFDLSGCDLRLRLVAFKVTNADDEGDYFNGLASTLAFACAATDDLTRAPGDEFEDSTSEALGWLGTGACGQVMGAPGPGLQMARAAARLPMLRAPTPAQAYLPGLF